MNGDFVEIKQPFNDNPTQQEIEEYAAWLGADLQNDRDLFWIAKEALRAPIPPGWKLFQRKDGTGEPFYFNMKTGESLWDHPLDAHYKELFKEEKAKKMRAGSMYNAKPLLSSNSNTYQSSSFNEKQQKMENELQQNFEEKKKILMQRNENEIKELTMRMDQEIEELRASHRKKMESIRTANEAEKEAQDALSAQLKQKRSNMDQELRKYQQKLEEQKEELETTFKNEIQQLKTSHQREIDNEKNKLEIMKRAMQEEFENEKSRHEREMSILKKANETAETEEEQILAEKEIQNEKIDSMRAEFEKKKNALVNKFNDEIEQLKIEHNTRIADLKNKQKEEISEHRLKMNQRNELDKMISNFENKKNELKQKQDKEIQIFIKQQQRELEEIRKKGEQEQIELKMQLQAQNEKITPKNNNSLQQPELDQIKKQIEQKCRHEIEQKYQAEIEKMRIEYENKISSLKQRPTDFNLPLEKQLKKHELELKQASENHQLEMRLLKASFEIEKKRLQESINKELENIDSNQKQESKKKHRSRYSNMSFASFIQISMSSNQRLNKNPLNIAKSSEFDYSSKQPLLQFKKEFVFDINPIAQFQFNPHFPQISQIKANYSQMNNNYGQSLIQQSQLSQQQLLLSSHEQVHKLKKIHNNVDQSCLLLNDSMKFTANEVEKSAQNFEKFLVDQNKVMNQMQVEFQSLATKLSTSFNNIFDEIDNSYREAVSNLSFKNQTQIAPMQIPYQIVMQQSPPSSEMPNRVTQSQPSKKHRSRSHREREYQNKLRSVDDSEIERIEADFQPLKRKIEERRKASEPRIDPEVSRKLKKHAEITKKSNKGIRQLQYKLKAMRDFVDNSD